MAVELMPTNPDRIADEVSSVSLSDLLKYGARDKIEKLRRISLVASKQFLLDRQLRKMQNELRQTRFLLRPWKATHVPVLQKSDEVMALLDDQLIKTSNILASPYIAGKMQTRALRWEATLIDASNLVKLWIEVQRAWVYLQPIFGSDDIQR